MTYRLNPALLEKIKSTTVIITPNGESKEYSSGLAAVFPVKKINGLANKAFGCVYTILVGSLA